MELRECADNDSQCVVQRTSSLIARPSHWLFFNFPRFLSSHHPILEELMAWVRQQRALRKQVRAATPARLDAYNDGE
jgi:hypothetical protein